MIGSHSWLWLALVAAAIGVLFYTSHQAQELQAALAVSDREILREQQAIRVLRAEWAYLNEPNRLRDLAREFTTLGPLLPNQVVAGLDDIPIRLPGLPPLASLPLPASKPGAAIRVAERPADAAPPGLAPPLPRRPARAPRTLQPRSVDGDSVDVLLAAFRARQAAGAAGVNQ